jgi:TRAP-type C4-dicarboxylate transport system permease small subunit
MYRAAFALSKAMALLGGIVLILLILITCLSILGRAVNTLLHSDTIQAHFGIFAEALLSTGVGPIKGDFEIVQAGLAFCIFAFLPWTQITGGHASVDLFVGRLPVAAQRFLAAATEVVFAVVLCVIAVQLKAGLDSKLASGQSSFILQYPIWWGYAASLVSASVAALVGVVTAAARLQEAATGNPILEPIVGETR